LCPEESTSEGRMWLNCYVLRSGARVLLGWLLHALQGKQQKHSGVSILSI